MHRLQPASARFLSKYILTYSAEIPASKCLISLQTTHIWLPVLQKIRAACIRPWHHLHPKIHHTQSAILHHAGPPLAPHPTDRRPLTALNNRKGGYPCAEWNRHPIVLIESSSLAAPVIVIWAMSDATSDENVVRIPVFQINIKLSIIPWKAKALEKTPMRYWRSAKVMDQSLMFDRRCSVGLCYLVCLNFG